MDWEGNSRSSGGQTPFDHKFWGIKIEHFGTWSHFSIFFLPWFPFLKYFANFPQFKLKNVPALLHLAYHFSTNMYCKVFGVEVDVRNERKRVCRMWEIFQHISALKSKRFAAADSLLHSHNFAQLCQQLSTSETGGPLDQILDPHLDGARIPCTRPPRSSTGLLFKCSQLKLERHYSGIFTSNRR